MSLHSSLESLEARILPAITFQFDFTYDSTGFFDPDAHPERRELLEQAGNEIGSRLDDTLQEIIPHKFSTSDTWTATFEDPATGNLVNVVDPIIGEDIIRVYVGARDLGSSLGSGGPGFASSVSGVQQWIDTVLGRGQSGALGPDSTQTDFGPFGGSISFNETVDWHFGLSTLDLEPGEFDFFSTAVHELTHLIGFGSANSFLNLSSGGVFNGSAAVLEHDGAGPVPMEDPGHWRQDLIDDGNEVAMDPDLQDGTRKLLTNLDFAALRDLGWETNGGNSYDPDILLASLDPNSLVIQDDGISGNGLSEYIVNGGTPVSFATEADDLLVVGGDNDDSISILSIDSLFTGEILVRGDGGDDLLTVDHNIADTLTYNGELGDDSLALNGSTATSVTHSFTNANDGSILVADGSDSTIFYAGLEPIFDSIQATDRFFDFRETDDVILLDDEGTPGNGIMRLSSVSSSETVHFSSPLGRVVINAGAGDDSVTLKTLDGGFSAAVEVRGGSGSDLLTATGAASGYLLKGQAGADTLQGGDGDDTLVGNEGDDELTGNGGDDSLAGGAGTDTLVQSGDVDLVLDASTLIGLGVDVFADIEQASLRGGVSANRIDADRFSGPVTVQAGGGDDTVIGSAFDDAIFGGDGRDELSGGDGNDLVNGQGESDQISGGAGDDVVLGGSGNDSLDGGAGADDLRGHAQDDQLTGGAGDDTIEGNDGVDQLLESGNVDFVLTDTSLTGRGSDVLRTVETAQLAGGISRNRIDASGFTGNTTLRGLGGADTLIGGSASDTLIGFAGPDSLIGNDGADTLLGSAGRDTLVGGNGNDRLRGQGSSGDHLFGGFGDDDLNGGPGSDSLDGEDGADTLDGGTGNDSMAGGAGNDLLLGGHGHDFLDGGAADDTLVGNEGNDVLMGGTGRDGLDGSRGNDIVNGEAGDDTLFGGAGRDSMFGGAGDDLALGLSGDDVVRGQGGTDIIAGGSGSGADPGDIVDDDPAEIDEVFALTFPDWVDTSL